MHKAAKIGLFGGTFDPPHNAHLNLAHFVLKALKLDLIYFIPAALHALKNNISLTAQDKRYDMLCVAVENNDKFRVSKIELELLNTSYTVDTLRAFRDYEKLGNAELYYILGSDNLYEIHLWKNPEEIFHLAKVVVLRRPGYQDTSILEKYKDKITILQSPLYDISSSDIRRKIRKGISVKDYVPERVMEKIRAYKLYQK